jgi:hypothetical protein
MEDITVFSISLQDTSRPGKGKRGTEKEKGEENQQ